jgi:fructokinase
MRKTILAFGEILWDILPDQTILGGAPFNFAYRVNSLGDDAQFVSSLGRDELGEAAYAQVVELGVDTALLQRNAEVPTGTVDVSFDENHMPDYVINPNVAYDFIELNTDLLDTAAQADCLAFGTLIQRAETSRRTLYELINTATNAKKFYDINLRKDTFSEKTVSYSLNAANILKINDDEVWQLKDILDLSFTSFQDFCALALDKFDLDFVLITFGDKGAFAQSSRNEQTYVPGYKIDLADSLGSGDAFSAAFIHKLLNGASLQDACDYGNALGALVATTHGGTSIISKSEIDAFLQNGHERMYHPDFSKS